MNRIILDNDERDYLDWRPGSGGTVEVVDIAVGSVRRRGKGRRLMESLFREIEPDTNVYAITRATNEVAQRYYEALGFHSSPLRRFYGPDPGVSAILYVRPAGGPV